MAECNEIPNITSTGEFFNVVKNKLFPENILLRKRFAKENQKNYQRSVQISDSNKHYIYLNI